MCHGCGILPPNCDVKFISFKVFLKDFFPLKPLSFFTLQINRNWGVSNFLATVYI